MKNKYMAPEAELLKFTLALDICEDASGIINPGQFPIGPGEEGDDDLID